MWSDLTSKLGLYGNFVLFAALFMLLLAGISIVLIRFISWKSWTIKFYGIFIGMKQIKMLALALIIVRAMFIGSILAFPVELQLTHIYFGILATAIINLILADISVLIFDLIYMVLIYGELYVKGLVGVYLKTIQMKGSIIAMLIVIIIFAIATTIYSTLELVRSTIKSGKREKRRINHSILLQRLIVIVSGAFIIAFPYYFINRIDVFTISQDLYQYTLEGFTTYQGESKITKSGNGSVLTNNEIIYELEDTPLYYSEESKILLPFVTSIIQPKLSLTNRITNMSTVYRRDEKYYVNNGKETIKVADFFLYDGKNTYYFFEPTTLVWNDQHVIIEPFSYVEVKYNQSLKIFNGAEGVYSNVETGVCNVTATMNCKATINLSTDILSREDGQKQMLFLNPNLLEDLH